MKHYEKVMVYMLFEAKKSVFTLHVTKKAVFILKAVAKCSMMHKLGG